MNSAIQLLDLPPGRLAQFAACIVSFIIPRFRH
jgi:hypothetical protein